jgi:hypothetical protein
VVQESTLPLSSFVGTEQSLLFFSTPANYSKINSSTRYLKRGVSDLGKVANDVELEQIVHEEGVSEGIFSSFLQVRGSIPTFWTQETSVTMPKPPIVLNRIDPTYTASQLHFADLLERYSAPVIVLDLTKHHEKREREMIVSSEYRTAIEYLNSNMTAQQRIQYCALDFSHISKQRGLNVLNALEEVAGWALRQTGFFCSAPRQRIDPATGDVQAAKSIKSQNDKDEDHHADRDDYEEAADATGCGSGAEKGGHDNDDGGGEPRAMATSIASSGKQEWGKQKQMQQQQQLIAGGVRGVEASSSLSLSLVGELSSSSATLTSSGPPVVASKRDGKAPARTEGRFNGWHGTEGTGEPDDTMVAEPGAAYVSSVLNLVDMKGKALLAMEQRGVLRTNCIDCLDRTNVAQFTVGVHALGRQLATMGVTNSATLESDSQIVLVLMDVYSIVGDQIALQYGGSEAHKKVKEQASEVAGNAVAATGGKGGRAGAGGGIAGKRGVKPGSGGGKHKELLTSIRRYYSNAFTDRLKQDAMNVFLGHYIVSEHEVPLWELENDYYLHNFHVQKGVELSMKNLKEPWELVELVDRNGAGFAQSVISADGVNAARTSSPLAAAFMSSNKGVSLQTPDWGVVDTDNAAATTAVTAVVSLASGNNADDNDDSEEKCTFDANVAAAVAAARLSDKELAAAVAALASTVDARTAASDATVQLLPKVSPPECPPVSSSSDESNGTVGNPTTTSVAVPEHTFSSTVIPSAVPLAAAISAPEVQASVVARTTSKDVAMALTARRAVETTAVLAEQRRRQKRKHRRVRVWCTTQRSAARKWWQEAIHRYVQQRMWMHLGPPSEGTAIMRRFERIHRPDKLTQFDKLFSHDFMVPTSIALRTNDASGGESAAGLEHGHQQQEDEEDEQQQKRRPYDASVVAAIGNDVMEQGGDDGPDRVVTIGRLVKELFVSSNNQQMQRHSNSHNSQQQQRDQQQLLLLRQQQQQQQQQYLVAASAGPGSCHIQGTGTWGAASNISGMGEVGSGAVLGKITVRAAVDRGIGGLQNLPIVVQERLQLVNFWQYVGDLGDLSAMVGDVNDDNNDDGEVEDEGGFDDGGRAFRQQQRQHILCENREDQTRHKSRNREMKENSKCRKQQQNRALFSSARAVREYAVFAPVAAFAQKPARYYNESVTLHTAAGVEFARALWEFNLVSE